MNRERENLKAGVFVLTGGVLALVVIFVLSDIGRLFERQQTVRVYYQLSDGLQGLKEGAPVTLGDQPIGEVTRIEDKIDQVNRDTTRVVGKIITAHVPKRYQLFQNAIIELKAPLIGSGTSLNIRSVGVGNPYKDKEPIPGSLAGTMQVQELIREAGIGEQQREEIRQIIANVESVTATLRDDTPHLTDQAKQIMTDVQAAAGDLKAAIAQANSMLVDLGKYHEPWVARIDNVTQSAEQALAEIRDLVRDKAPAVRNTLDNVHSVTQTAKDKTVAQVTQALDSAVAALDSFKATSEQIKTLVVGQRPVLERAMANMQLTADQLKLTAIEVRRSPWRLMYTPDKAELDSDNLYDAARSFASAASALDTTADSLRVLADDPTVQQGEVQKMLNHLEAVFSKYSVAEKAFWKELGVGSVTP